MKLRCGNNDLSVRAALTILLSRDSKQPGTWRTYFASYYVTPMAKSTEWELPICIQRAGNFSAIRWTKAGLVSIAWWAVRAVPPAAASLRLDVVVENYTKPSQQHAAEMVTATFSGR